MNTEYLCLGCMSNKGIEDSCPYCGFNNLKYEQDGIALTPGSVLKDRYIIGKTLGTGGFGITYIAWDKTLEVSMAIKEYLPSSLAMRMSDEQTVRPNTKATEQQFTYYMDRFLEEARALAKFNDEQGIVSVQDVFNENGTIYIVMYYVNGIDLNQYLKNHGGIMKPYEALKIMRIVMQSLSKVHRSDLIHRDISPDNIYITMDHQVKLLDFGAARYTVGQGEKTISVILKHGFAPLEQYTSKGKQGPWTDVYASAATLYKLLTGKKPPEAIERVVEDNLVAPRELGVEISEAVEFAIMKALSVQIEDRFQTMDEFLAGLDGELNETVLLISEPSTKEKKKKKSLILVPITIIVLSIIASLIWKSFGSREQDLAKNLQTDNYNEPAIVSENNDDDDEKMTEKDSIVGEVGTMVSNNEKIKLNSLVGVEYTTIFTELNQHGITLEVKEEVYSELYAEGVVISQNYEVGSLLEKGDVVKVTVSKGSEWLNIPKFSGLSKSQAESLAKENNIDIKFTNVSTNEYSDDKIYEQVPASNRVKIGTIIELKIANNFTVASTSQNSDESSNTTVETENEPVQEVSPPVQTTSETEEENQDDSSQLENSNTRVIASWLIQEYDDTRTSMVTKVDLNNLPSELSGIKHIRVLSTNNLTQSLINSRLYVDYELHNFHQVVGGWGQYNSSVQPDDQFLIRLGDGTRVVAYAAVYSDGDYDLVTEVETQEVAEADTRYDIKKHSEHLYATESRTNQEMDIQPTDGVRTLPFGIQQTPYYNQDSFTTVITKASLPSELQICNQLDVQGTNMSIDEYVGYVYGYLDNGDNHGIRYYADNTVMSFNSSGSYYHDHIVGLLHDNVLKAIIKIATNGEITYKSISE